MSGLVNIRKPLVATRSSLPHRGDQERGGSLKGRSETQGVKDFYVTLKKSVVSLNPHRRPHTRARPRVATVASVCKL